MADPNQPPLERVQAGRPSPREPLQEWLFPVWTAKTSILKLSAVVTGLSIIVNFFFLPNYYKATATLLPETENDRLGTLGQFADIISLGAVDASGGNIARLYPVIVSSDVVLRSVIRRQYQTLKFNEPVDLISYLEMEEETEGENMARAIKEIRACLDASLDAKTSVVTLTLEMQESELAADVLNSLVRELDHFMRSEKVTNASERVEWLEMRLREVKDSLRAAEDTLQDFRTRNRRVADSPQLLLEQGRLVRDVELNSTLFVELKKQFELAKLEEIKNLTIVNVLDSATPPVRKERPRRALNIAVMLFLSLVLPSGYYVLRSMYRDHMRRYLHSFKTR